MAKITVISSRGPIKIDQWRTGYFTVIATTDSSIPYTENAYIVLPYIKDI